MWHINKHFTTVNLYTVHDYILQIYLYIYIALHYILFISPYNTLLLLHTSHTSWLNELHYLTAFVHTFVQFTYIIFNIIVFIHFIQIVLYQFSYLWACPSAAATCGFPLGEQYSLISSHLTCGKFIIFSLQPQKPVLLCRTWPCFPGWWLVCFYLIIQRIRTMQALYQPKWRFNILTYCPSTRQDLKVKMQGLSDL